MSASSQYIIEHFVHGNMSDESQVRMSLRELEQHLERYAESRLAELEQGWIPVGEKLPEPLVSEVFVFSKKFGRIVAKCDHYKYAGAKVRFYAVVDYEGGDTELTDVTHWRPMPEPPKRSEP